MSRKLLLRAEVYSESSMALFDLVAILNGMSHKMVKKLHLSVRTSYRTIKVANCASEKGLGSLNYLPISMTDLVVLMNLFVPEETLYYILIGLPTMVLLRASQNYFRTVLKSYHESDSEILNYECERYSRNTSEDESTSDGIEDEERFR